MEIYVELIVLVFIILFVLLWKLWEKKSLAKLIKNYDPQNDKGKKGRPESRASNKTEVGTGIPTINTDGLEQPERRSSLQETSIGSNGEDGNVNREDKPNSGKSSSSLRKFFKRRRVKKNESGN